MDRTYNVFVDNGMFVLGYYLEKSIEDITYEDIENSIPMMSEKINRFVECEKYSNLKSMCFANSCLTQTKSTIQLEDQLLKFMNLKGEEYCEKCGKYHATVKNSITRSYFPNAVANTFYNYSNNLQGINICPYCITLTMYSILNSRVTNLVILNISDDDEYMYDYTSILQEENDRDVLLDAKKVKGGNQVSAIENILSNSKIYDGYIEVYKYNNSGQTQKIETKSIKSKEVAILNKIIKSGYLNEFKQFGLMKELLDGKISFSYLYKIYDYKTNELKCSRELFDILNREVNMLDVNIVNIIKQIANKINKLDSKKIINRVKLINNFNDYEELFVSLKEDYMEKFNEELYTIDEYIEIDNIRKYKQIKNLLLVSLI